MKKKYVMVVVVFSGRRNDMAIPRDKVKRYRVVLRNKEHVSVKLNMTSSFRESVTTAVAETKKNGNPVAKYDVQNRRPYLEYPDGTRSYVG